MPLVIEVNRSDGLAEGCPRCSDWFSPRRYLSLYIGADALSLVIGSFVLISVGLQVGGLRPPRSVLANY